MVQKRTEGEAGKAPCVELYPRCCNTCWDQLHEDKGFFFRGVGTSETRVVGTEVILGGFVETLINDLTLRILR